MTSPLNKPKAIIFDVDGTLCDVSSIRHLVDTTDPKFEGKKQFDRFHCESINCPPHRKVVDAFHDAKADGIVCIVATGRAEKHRTATRWWLHSHDLLPEQQLHRPADDYRPDVVVKREMLDLLEQHYEIIEVWDDNPRVIEMWQAAGLKVNIMPGWPVRDGIAVEATSEKECASNGS